MNLNFLKDNRNLLVKKKMNGLGSRIKATNPNINANYFQAQINQLKNDSGLSPYGRQQNNRNAKAKVLGFLKGRQVYGNHLKGSEWVEEQNKRKNQQMVVPHPQNAVHPQLSSDDQVVFIEPSVSEKKLREHKNKGQDFEDDDFPPDVESMVGEGGDIQDWNLFEWKKIVNLIPNAKIFQGKVEPNDIQQGYLGDCYFLAGLAALSERPDRIFDLFITKETNEHHYYSVKILYRGKWRTIDIDDYFPFYGDEPAFSKSNQKELWVMVLEKAWAKVYGSYRHTEGGFPQEPLHDLTGAPIRHIFLKPGSKKTMEDDWEYLLEASEKEFAMVASSLPGRDTDKSPNGISQGHAYTFLNATEIEVAGRDRKVVQLRNPWGKGEYTGTWSDKDKIWNMVSQEEKERVHYEGVREDGIFFMQFEDFAKQFKNITVAEIDDDASYVYESHWDPQVKGAYFTIDISHADRYSLQVDKTPERSFTGNKQINYRYPQTDLNICRIVNGKGVKMQSAGNKKRTLFKWYDMEPGTYVVYVKTCFDQKFEEDFQVTLAVYSDYTCKIRLASAEEAKILDARASWSGKKAVPPKENHPEAKRSSKKQLSTSTSLQSPRHQNAISFLKNRDRGGIKLPEKEQAVRNQIKIEPEAKKSQTNAASSASSTLTRKKKVKKVETKTTTHETYQVDQDGRGSKSTTSSEIKIQTITRHKAEGESILRKQMNKKIDVIEKIQKNQTTHMKEQIVEEINIRHTKPDGSVVQSTQTQKEESETLFQDDSGVSSILNSQLEVVSKEMAELEQRSSPASQNNSIQIQSVPGSKLPYSSNYQQNKNPQEAKSLANKKGQQNQTLKLRSIYDQIRHVEPDSDDED